MVGIPTLAIAGSEPAGIEPRLSRRSCVVGHNGAAITVSTGRLKQSLVRPGMARAVRQALAVPGFHG
jgi:hypothetical protein